MGKLRNNEDAPMQATLDLDRDLLKHTFRMIGIQKEENANVFHELKKLMVKINSRE
jgi:hypothetical protein